MIGRLNEENRVRLPRYITRARNRFLQKRGRQKKARKPNRAERRSSLYAAADEKHILTAVHDITVPIACVRAHVHYARLCVSVVKNVLGAL